MGKPVKNVGKVRAALSRVGRAAENVTKTLFGTSEAIRGISKDGLKMKHQIKTKDRRWFKKMQRKGIHVTHVHHHRMPKKMREALREVREQNTSNSWAIKGGIGALLGGGAGVSGLLGYQALKRKVEEPGTDQQWPTT